MSFFAEESAQRPLFDEEAGGTLQQDFHDKYERRIRHDFMRKVYGIVLMQLLFTAGLSLLATQRLAVYAALMLQPWVLPVCGVGVIVCQLLVFCVPWLGRSFPVNYVLLAVFTACFSVSVAYTVCAVSSDKPSHGGVSGNVILLQALVVTTVVVVGLTVFACQTKFDFTSLAGVLALASFALLGVGIVRMFFARARWLEIGIAAASAILLSLYIVVDTQLLLDRLSEDDYVAAAMMLYADVIMLFLQILRLLLLSQRRED